MKNKKPVLILSGIVLVIVIIIALFIINKPKDATTGQQTLTPTPTANPTLAVNYENGNLKYTIVKDTVTKTATLTANYAFTNDEEFTVVSGTKETMVPMLVNFGCAMINNNFYDPAANDAFKKTYNIPASILTRLDALSQEFNTNLGTDYKIVDFTINYTDAATSAAIATCESTQKGNASIKFTVVNSFAETPSRLGYQIGVYKNN